MIGAGQLVALGDANAFTSPSGDAGVLVANICGNRRTTASAVDCLPASALVGAAVSCTTTVTDTDSGTAITPTGAVSFTQGGAGAGTFAGGGACTLVAGSTTGVATCTVSYSATAPGAQTLSAAYAGTTRSFSSSGSSPHVATLPPPPTATGGQSTAPYGEAQTFQVAIPAGGSVTLLDNGQPATSVSFAGVGVYALNTSTGVITFTPAAAFSGAARSVGFRVIDSYGQFSDASFGASVAAPPVVPPTSTTGAAVPTAPPTVCVSRRLLIVHFRVPAGTKVRSLRASIAGDVHRMPAKTRQLKVDLRGTGRHSVRVVLVAKVAGGAALRAERRYRTCATVPSASTPDTVYLARDSARPQGRN